MNIVEAIDFLDNFSNSDDLADYFLYLGIKGYREDEYACPIANWVSNVTGVPVSVDDEIHVFHSNYEDKETYPLGETPKKFIVRFDNGDFEFLENWEEF